MGPKIIPFIFLSVPLLPKATSILIILYALGTLPGFRKKYFKNLLYKKDFLLYMLLYILLIFGLSYTIDYETGISKVQTQLSFLVFPLFLGGQLFSSKLRQTCLTYFVIGLAITTILCFGYAVYRAISMGDFYVLGKLGQHNNIFFYQEFSGLLNLHPTYFSLYLGVGLFCLMDDHFSKQKLNCIVRIFFLILFFVALFLTSSKAGIFSFIIVVLGYYAYKVVAKRRTLHIGILSILIFCVLAMFTVNPVFQKRTVQGLTSFKKAVFENKFVNESTSIRFHLWLLTLKTAKESLIYGYGTGSTQEILNEKCISSYAFSTCETLRNKNSHNQFLNFLLSNGIIFVLIFITALTIGLVRAVQSKDRLLMLFLVFISLNFLFESLLQRERGIVFFMLFVVALSISDHNSNGK